MPFLFVPCIISRGGFSSERTFAIEQPDGGRLVGTANVDYLRDEHKSPLGDDQPPFGVEIDGFVQCRALREEEGRVLVEVPSTDLIRVSRDDLVQIE